MKKIIVFGDSIAAGQEIIRGESPYRNFSYPNVAAKILNLSIRNLAEPGTGQFKGRYELDKKTGWEHNFTNMILKNEDYLKEAQVVLIAYGNNDWKQLTSDGRTHTLDDVRNKLKENINLIRNIKQTIKIIGILETNSFRKNRSAEYLEGPNGFAYHQMVDTYHDTFEENDVLVFDMREYGLGMDIEEYIDNRDHFTLNAHYTIGTALADFFLENDLN